MSWMGIEIHSNITEFLLLGFSDFSPVSQSSIMAFFVFSYICSVLGNGLIIVLATAEPHLDTPMYFFLRNLSFIELCTTNVVVPKVLENLWSGKKSISFLGCAAQMSVFFTFAVSECVFLMMMAFDRYMAICCPLRYTSVMNTGMCYKLTTGSWVVGSLVYFSQTWYIFSLPYCNSNHIVHFFCDFPPVLTLACADTFIIKLSVSIACICGAALPLLVIFCSYIKILYSVLFIRSMEGRHKALSTCGAHLVSVVLYYGTAMFMYLRLGTSGPGANDRMIALFYCIIIPTVNPLIYSLRNKDMKTALGKHFKLFPLSPGIKRLHK
ncbi:PREDICTED: olfactory receptor 10AG1-like [Nanorana parkeri]|uniref:olfactory receptor 10AG1-like n=1 Tax=Nanorana parkeri TaxID=125878 RepID=UPI00085489FE|nr:PREDICTED: olfactory receptor 10AG1-like [Nanorana parkeri]